MHRTLKFLFGWFLVLGLPGFASAHSRGANRAMDDGAGIKTTIVYHNVYRNWPLSPSMTPAQAGESLNYDKLSEGARAEIDQTVFRECVAETPGPLRAAPGRIDWAVTDGKITYLTLNHVNYRGRFDSIELRETSPRALVLRNDGSEVEVLEDPITHRLARLTLSRGQVTDRNIGWATAPVLQRTFVVESSVVCYPR